MMSYDDRQHGAVHRTRALIIERTDDGVTFTQKEKTHARERQDT